jgi:hypothetical protein
MRIRSVILGLGLVAVAGLTSQASAQAVAQPANKPVAKNVKRVAASSTPAASQAPAAAPADQTMAAKPKPKPKRKASQRMAGVPKGVPACLKHLSKMAEKEPLIDYDGHPSEIINGGLLWNDPKSRCSVAGDEAMKKKAVELAGAWRKKDAAQVRSLLAELEAGSK